MPKKAGKKKAKKKEASEDAEENGVVDDSNEKAKRAALIEELKALKDESLNEMKLINEAQQTKSKIENFWTLGKQQRDDLRMDLRSKFRQKQDLQEKQQYEIKIYRQKVRHLLHEHQENATDKQIDSEVSLSLHQTSNRTDESELRSMIRSLGILLREKEVSQVDLLKDMKVSQGKKIMEIRIEYERAAEETKQYFEKRMKAIRKEAARIKKNDLRCIETRKTKAISKLMAKHKQEFNDIKNYYTTVTHNNLDLIRQLKDEVVDMRRRENADEKAMVESEASNRKLSEPLKKHQKDVEELKVELKNYTKDKILLKQTKERVTLIEQNLKKLSWEHELLQQQYEQVQDEKSNLYSSLEKTIYDHQQKFGFKELLLEKSLGAMKENLEIKETQITEVMLSANMNANVTGKSLDVLLSEKNNIIATLESELRRWRDSYINVIRSYEGKLDEFGIPASELGFEPKLV